VVSTLKLTKIQIPNSDSDVISLDASTGNITLNKTLGGTSVTIQGEGTNTTNLQQGLSKWWCSVTQSSNSVNDSFNVSGTTDTGTGRTQYGYTNNMSNTGYCVVSTSRDGGGYNDVMNVNSCTDSTFSSSQMELFHQNANTDGSGNPNDTNGPLWAVAHGDLA